MPAAPATVLPLPRLITDPFTCMERLLSTIAPPITKNTPKTLRSSPSTSTIDFLPPELLLIIFNYLFQGEQVECDSPTCMACLSSSDGQTHLVWRTITNPASMIFFPYTVANVCRRWRDIMSIVPKFWTRLVFLVGSDSDPGTGESMSASAQLSWSRELSLDVTVMRHPDAPGKNNEIERRRVREITGALMPHVDRCTVLSFDVMHSSSLPSVRRDLSLRRLSNLSALVLKSIQDNGLSHYQSWPGTTESIIENHFPLLTTLAIDGPNFVDLCTHIINTGGKSFNPFRQLGRLTIANLSSLNTLPLNSVLEKILCDETMPSLFYLRLDNVYFTPTHSRLPHQQHHVLSPTHLELENLDGIFAESFSEMVEFHALEYTYITKTELTSSFRVPHSWSVALEHLDINEMSPEPFIGWRGGTLDVDNCSGFTDHFLEVISKPSFLNWGEFGCPNLQELHIYNCPNFTVQGLKTMVANRNESLGDRQALVEDDDNPPVIIELHVTGQGPSLSLEDRAWFQRKIALFQWDTE